MQVFTIEEALVIVMEYASGGPLEERIATSGPLSETASKKLFRQLIEGLQYCHDQVPRCLMCSVNSAKLASDCLCMR